MSLFVFGYASGGLLYLAVSILGILVDLDDDASDLQEARSALMTECVMAFVWPAVLLVICYVALMDKLHTKQGKPDQ